jgi:hypothetical protein
MEIFGKKRRNTVCPEPPVRLNREEEPKGPFNKPLHFKGFQLSLDSSPPFSERL